MIIRLIIVLLIILIIFKLPTWCNFVLNKMTDLDDYNDFSNYEKYFITFGVIILFIGILILLGSLFVTTCHYIIHGNI